MSYDLDKMKAEAKRLNRPFTLFGGEPLLMRFEDLENLFAWGLENFGRNAIQTNAVLIEQRHIELFRRYKVSVGVSMDGPGELNDARWNRGQAKTRESTAKAEAAIERLCREYVAPGLIVTLHKGNGTMEKLPLMAEWVRRLHAMGIRTIRLHLLEVDHQKVRDELALSPRENIEAMLALASVQQSLPGMRMDLFEDVERLLAGEDAKVGCIWRACDPYTTDAVQGIEGNGQSSNCGRTNKDGIGFIKANRPGFERYVALYRTPQSENGCGGCRFFLMCKGQCPGTAIDGDWRNRTEHCKEWKHLFGMIERRMILEGKQPLSVQPVRFELERRQIEAWARGRNPSIQSSLEKLRKEVSTNPLKDSIVGSKKAAANMPRARARVSWVSPAARLRWEKRLDELSTLIEDMTVHAARGLHGKCSARVVPRTSLKRLIELAETHGLAWAELPVEALPGGIYARWTDSHPSVFIAGTAEVISKVKAAGIDRTAAEVHSFLDLPQCCLNFAAKSIRHEGAAALHGTINIPASVPTHTLLAPLELSALAIHPCRYDCTQAIGFAECLLQTMAELGFASQAAWLRDCLAWPLSYSELHGIAEIKTPVFKLCFDTGVDLGHRRVLRNGSGLAEEGAVGLSFPFAPPSTHQRVVQIENAL
jgi:uncharacterized protein